MPWLSIGASILGGLISSDSTEQASQAQTQSTDQATGEQRRQYDTTRADFEPYRGAGAEAIQDLRVRLGLATNQGQSQYERISRPFTLADFWNDPVTTASYQSGLDLGAKAISNMAGARGMKNSGSTLKALTRFGNDYTGQQAGASQARYTADRTNEFNRLASVAGVGQTASNTVANAGANMANTVGGLMSAQGNARGAAAIAGGNAIGGGIQNAGNYYGQQQTLNQILGRNAAPSYSSAGFDWSGQGGGW